MAAVYLAAAREGWKDMYPIERLEHLQSPEARFAVEIEQRDQDRAVLVAELHNEIVGFAIIRPSPDDDADPQTVGELDMLYSRPATWGTGVAQALMAAVLEKLRTAGYSEATLRTDERNLRPRRFYETSGWRPDGATSEKTFLGVGYRELRYRISLLVRI